MKIDKYDKGKWIQNCCDIPWCIEDSRKEFLKKNGYDFWGDAEPSDIEFRVYAKVDEEKVKYLIEISYMSETRSYLLIEDMQSLLIFYKEFIN